MIVVVGHADEIASRMQRRPQRRVGEALVKARCSRPPACRAAPARRRRATALPCSPDHRRAATTGRSIQPRSLRISRRQEATRPRARQSWVRSPWRGRRDLKRRRDSQCWSPKFDREINRRSSIWFRDDFSFRIKSEIWRVGRNPAPIASQRQRNYFDQNSAGNSARQRTENAAARYRNNSPGIT